MVLAGAGITIMDGTQVTAAVKRDLALTWIQRHERILIISLVLAVGCWLGNSWINRTVDKDKLEATVSAQQLHVAQVDSAQHDSQVKDATAVYQQTVALLQQQNSELRS